MKIRAWGSSLASPLSEGALACINGLQMCRALPAEYHSARYAVWKLGHPHYAQLRKGISHRETNLTELRFNHYWVRCKVRLLVR